MFYVLVIIIILLLYYYSDYCRRRRYKTKLQKSAGIYDAEAAAALHELLNIRSPTAEDLFARGSIYRYNILENDHRPRSNESANQRQLRLSAINNTINDYNDALNLLHQPNTNATFAPAFIQRNIETLNFGQAILQKPNIITFDDQIYTSDPQNVHDTHINKDLREVLYKLRDTWPGPPPTDSIIDAIDYAMTNDKMNSAVINALDVIREGNYISTYDDYEHNIFSYTWERCNHPLNADNSNLMKDAIINALVECTENGKMVCINGRVGRVLNSLATLDYDTTMNGAMTYEAYKNQIFYETRKILTREILRAEESGDPEMVDIARSYTENIQTNPVKELQFKAQLRAEIDANLATYSGKFTSDELNKLRDECYAGVDA